MGLALRSGGRGAQAPVGSSAVPACCGSTVARRRAVDAGHLGGQFFVNARHPRTIIGTDVGGNIWIAAVDRSAAHSIGMTFADLEGLCDRLGLTGALNLDGGSSTVMLTNGRVVNQPVDAEKAVNNAVVVTLR